jgi:hypothetical protein
VAGPFSFDSNNISTLIEIFLILRYQLVAILAKLSFALRSSATIEAKNFAEEAPWIRERRQRLGLSGWG